MEMPTVTNRCSTMLPSLLLACLASLTAAHAFAQDPCRVLAQEQTLRTSTDGTLVPLPFGGCWYPERPADGLPPEFAGMNGELLGKIALSFRPSQVVIANSAGDMRRTEIQNEMSPIDRTLKPAGASFAYWEARTLVLRTIGLEQNTVDITERISLKDPDTLEYALHVVRRSQPKAALAIRVLYHRDVSDNVGTQPCSP
jgi:hypothetical protein